MKALVIQHDHVSPAGPVGTRLLERGIETVMHPVVSRADFDNPGITTTFPALDDIDLIVPMGSPWSVYDLDLIGSWVRPEMDLLREADERGIPVLGICFGGQLLAQAHGGSVRRSAAAEIGYVDIETDQPDLISTGPWFEWHHDQWQLPPGATEIARNGVSSQAFVLRRNLALQFHPEITPSTLELWLEEGGVEEAREHGRDPDQLRADARAQDTASRARAFALVDAFVDRFVVGDGDFA